MKNVWKLKYLKSKGEIKMREINSIILHKVIVHVLDKNMDQPLFADYEQEITEEIHELLEKHIIRSLKDDDNRTAKFISGPNVVRDNCDAMLYGESSFIESSKKIAQHLFNAMKSHGNVSPCDLVVCIYSVDNIKYVALLKMDYRKSHIHDVEYVGDKFKVSIIPQEIGLPGAGQRLQKCAFIKLYEANEQYDLIILDKQQTTDQDHEVANFFVKEFLNSNMLVDSKDKTKMFKNMTEKWVRNQLRQDIEQAEKVREVLADNLKHEEEINIRNFVEEAMNGNEEIQNDYIDYINNNGFQITSFEVNKPWVEKKLKKKSIKTDTGFEIKNDRDCFDDNLKFHVKKNGDGTVDLVIKNIVFYIEK